MNASISMKLHIKRQSPMLSFHICTTNSTKESYNVHGSSKYFIPLELSSNRHQQHSWNQSSSLSTNTLTILATTCFALIPLGLYLDMATLRNILKENSKGEGTLVSKPMYPLVYMCVCVFFSTYCYQRCLLKKHCFQQCLLQSAPISGIY